MSRKVSEENCKDRGRPITKLGHSVVSRRQFLRMTGMAAATLGAGAGMGSVLVACGEETTTTTSEGTTAAVATTAKASTASTSTTGVSAGAEKGDEIRVGWIAPLTGSLAFFGVPDKYLAELWQKAAGEGVVCGDGKLHPVTILMRDSQSDSNRAAQVSGDLINNSKIHVMMAASTPDTTVPVSDQCESLQTPCITTDTPWQAWLGSRTGGDLTVTFKWTYHVFWGLNQMQAVFDSIWNKVPNNKMIGALWPNDADGNAFRPSWTPFLQQKGYTLVDPGAFNVGTEDYSQQISMFKKAGCELLTGVVQPPDFTNFWKQAKQQGWTPRVATVGKALLFPQSVEAMADIADGLTTELWWHREFPFKSSLTGQTADELCADYEKATGQQWTPPLGLHHIVFEEVVDCLKHAKDPMDKESFMTAVRGMKLDSLAGPIDFTLPVDANSNHPVENVYMSPLAGAQWLKSGDPWPFKEVIIDNTCAPMVKVTAELKPLT